MHALAGRFASPLPQLDLFPRLIPLTLPAFPSSSHLVSSPTGSDLYLAPLNTRPRSRIGLPLAPTLVAPPAAAARRPPSLILFKR